MGSEKRKEAVAMIGVSCTAITGTRGTIGNGRKLPARSPGKSEKDPHLQPSMSGVFGK